MRHRLVHGYFAIDEDIVWKTLTTSSSRCSGLWNGCPKAGTNPDRLTLWARLGPARDPPMPRLNCTGAVRGRGAGEVRGGEAEQAHRLGGRRRRVQEPAGELHQLLGRMHRVRQRVLAGVER